MSLKIKEKQAIVDELKSKFLKSNIIILTKYKGLDVEAMNLLRRRLREAGVNFQVVKNSLLVRASNGNSVELIKNKFKGTSAVAFSCEDSIATAKVLTDFSSENTALKIETGVLGDRVLNIEEIKTLASLPSREILLSQLLLTMNGVPTGLVNVLNAAIVNFINILEAMKRNKEE